MSQTAGNISEEEFQQLLRTVEMFEAITEAQPDDYQSLEILKEAYTKLGRKPDRLRASRMLASAYQTMGHVSLAILECEAILQETPADAAIKELLAGLNSSTTMAATATPAAPSLEKDSKPTPPAGEPAGAPSIAVLRQHAEEGDRLLANLLVAEKLATQQAIEPLLQKLHAMRAEAGGRTQPFSLLQLIANEQYAKLDDLLTVVLDKSNLPYVPLSVYDVDRDNASLLPLDFCWQHCLIPFDVISRSVLITTANPFDMPSRLQVEQMLNRNVFWYVSHPQEIITALRRVHGLDTSKTPQAA
jgi:hypothetical protein